jgi:hypothetical protein
MDPRIPGHPADRRLDERVPVDGVEMLWGIGRRGHDVARVINVSRGGVLALVPRTRKLRPGIEVPVALLGGTGTVRVAYVKPSARWGWRLCGLDFVDGDMNLLASIEQILEDTTGAIARTWASLH